ncbi:protein STICHEL-like isoform X2 [Asparagus officinalis]|uniref:protein STICHEL-like isoform X2 n=1 Tax=Asparagus officinalis TaxID=4686 RepID=UPI00098E1E8B|nr:protein STICHEL-like isoform X2 [Asparagus officinalis]
MVETCVAPSELHLKKELTALQKAHYLRDPETCSSWKSPLSSNSFSASNKLNYGNGLAGKTGESDTRKMLEIPPSDIAQKRVYLYNWKNHSSKSSGNMIKLDDDDRQISIEDSLEDSFKNAHKADSTSISHLEVPSNISSFRGRRSKAPVRKTVKKLRNAVSNKQVKKDLVFNTVEQSEDTEYSNSEDLMQLTHVLTSKAAHDSLSESPLFSGSGCGNWSYSSKILRNIKKEVSSHSCTPASTSSYYRYYGGRNANIESWDGAATSIEGDELDQLDLPRTQGCGIPCYWPKRTKEKGCGGFVSPSLSDTLRRKGSSLFYSNKRSPGARRQKYLSKSSQGLPLLSNSCGEGNSSLDSASDEMSTNLGELELEALSRLDGRRWSSCKSQEGLQSVQSQEVDMDSTEHKSLSQKYCPRSFDEIVGQDIVVHSLNNAILMERIATAYLFQGPRGTGKTAIARIFAAALNCLSTEDNKPCGSCRECTSIFSGNGSNVREVDAINKKGINRVRYLLTNMSVGKSVSRYKVFIIDECHMLSSRMWSAFMNILQEPPSRIVFIFVTIDPDSLPRAIISHCQKYLFSKVKDVDIVSRLRKMAYEENLDIELDALDLIALNSDGSLRDAETMLDQLSLLGKRVTTSLVYELIGVVSDEKLLDLLEIAMSSDTAETVKRSREFMDSGVDPMALMSQLAALLMDIIAGSNQLADPQFRVNEDELKRLEKALKILSDAEKQLRFSSERSTWFTAALLQLGSSQSAEFTQSSSSSKHSTKEINDGIDSGAKDSSFTVQGSSSARVSRANSGYSSPQSCSSSYKVPRNVKLTSARLHGNDTYGPGAIMCISPDKLALMWRRCIQKCHSETLRQLLSSNGKLVSISETKSTLIASIVFEDSNVKSRAERYLNSIKSSFEIVLQHNVEVRIGLQSNPYSPSFNHIEKNRDSTSLKVSCNDKCKGIPNLPRKRLECSEARQQKTLEQGDSSLQKHADVVVEHRLERAWLQASDKNSIDLSSQSNPNKNQILPENGVSCENHKMSLISSKHWEAELNHEVKGLKIGDSQGQHKKQIDGQIDHYAISPSLLHSNGFTANSDKENVDYESGPGCNGFFCWQPRKSYSRKVKKGIHAQSPKIRRLHCLGSSRLKASKSKARI